MRSPPHILDQMPDDFTYNQLIEKIGNLRVKPLFPKDRQNRAFEVMWWLANSNYEVDFHPDHPHI